MRGIFALGKPVAWLMGSDGVSKLALLVATIVAARAMSPIELGRYIGLWATAVVAAALWDAGVSTLVTREIAAERMGVRRALGGAARLRMTTFVIWAAAFAVGATLVLGHSGGGWAAIAFAGASLTFGINTLLFGLLRGQARFRVAGITQASGRVTFALLALLIIPRVGQHHALLVLGVLALVGELVTLSASAALVVRAPQEAAVEDDVLTLRASLPFAANTLLSTVYNRLDVVIVPALAGVTQLALYAPASRIQDALYLIPFALGAAALPLLARVADNVADVDRITRHLVALGLWIAFPVTVITFIFSHWILTTVLGSEYASATSAMRILIWFLPLAVVQAPLFAALISVGRAVDTTRIIAATFAVALGMHIILDPIWGATGGAIASLSRDVVAVPLAVLVARRSGLLRAAATKALDVAALPTREVGST
jgi:O-antigen/teichoic acid export membrane protein